MSGMGMPVPAAAGANPGIGGGTGKLPGAGGRDDAGDGDGGGWGATGNWNPDGMGMPAPAATGGGSGTIGGDGGGLVPVAGPAALLLRVKPATVFMPPPVRRPTLVRVGDGIGALSRMVEVPAISVSGVSVPADGGVGA